MYRVLDSIYRVVNSIYRLLKSIYRVVNSIFRVLNSIYHVRRRVDPLAKSPKTGRKRWRKQGHRRCCYCCSCCLWNICRWIKDRIRDCAQIQVHYRTRIWTNFGTPEISYAVCVSHCHRMWHCQFIQWS